MSRKDSCLNLANTISWIVEDDSSVLYSRAKTGKYDAKIELTNDALKEVVEYFKSSDNPGQCLNLYVKKVLREFDLQGNINVEKKILYISWYYSCGGVGLNLQNIAGQNVTNMDLMSVAVALGENGVSE